MPEVRIRIAVGSTRLEYEGSRAFFDRAIAPLMDALAGGTAASADDEGAPLSPAPVVDAWTPASSQHFAQFASQVGDRAAAVDQRIMAFAFYLWNFEKQDVCTRAQIEAFFRTVHEEPPADLGERLEGLCRAKRFLEAVSPDLWRMSTKGLNYVKNRLLGPAPG